MRSLRFELTAKNLFVNGQNCLSVAVLYNCVWMQIIFCSCVNETTLFSFLRSFLREKLQIVSLPEDIHEKTKLVIE